ncbi:ATP synthase subunit I [Paenibacillus hemerocallicola]|uniref:ATP synthase subunit I n=1 Tax=Paenibacillus hemerocallicola TaxID=1172614 RepID=A0A5C4T7A5_9BACL|nr:ATP synthase subunit I [Paenibacillus hemerocallicola]TNJ64706.1 ATP synthase subunit I [Paenibacillus hemerocallicola]
MSDLAGFLKTISRSSMVLFAVGVVLWGALPSYRPYISGLLLGMLVSYANVLYLGMKTRQLGELVAQGERKRFNLGFLTRASLAVLAVMFAFKSEHVELVTTIIGLFYGQAALFVTAAVAFFRKSS